MGARVWGCISIFSPILPSPLYSPNILASKIRVDISFPSVNCVTPVAPENGSFVAVPSALGVPR